MKALAVAMLLACHPVAADDAADEDGKSAPLETGDTVERVPTRKDVTVPVLIRAGDHPTAVVLLYPGGGGRLGLTDKGLDKGADNFMVRTRGAFAKAGLVAVVVDAPSDHAESLRAYRISADGGEDSAKLVAWAAGRWKVPVWLVGTSRGTISVANAAARGAGMKGIVLTSSVTAGKRETIGDVAVDKITVPAFLVHHKHDACNASPLAGAQALAKTLHAKWLEVSGGDHGDGGSCSPESHHGYLGQDAEVVKAIADDVRSDPGKP